VEIVLKVKIFLSWDSIDKRAKGAERAKISKRFRINVLPPLRQFGL
jgi:hypothetical protein